MADNVLEVQHLRVEFPTRKGLLVAVDDVSFEIAEGEILGLVGESGAGKSLTGAAIIGLLEPPGHIAGGEINVGGHRIDNLSEKKMSSVRGRMIGAIFQDPLTSLDPLMTIGDQLVETIMRHLPLDVHEAKARAIELLSQTGIPGPEKRFNQYPHQFSGGMRQRVVIALALAARPKLIIADEPTTALDVSVQAQIIELLKKLAHEFHSGVLLITHDMGVVAEVADYVMIMYAGKVCEYNTAEAVFDRPLHPYTQGLLRSIPRRDQNVEELYTIPGNVPTIEEMPAGCRFATRCAYATERCLREDRAKCNVGPMSELGLIQFTRKKFKSDNVAMLTQKCPHCGGSGAVLSDSYIAFRIQIAVKRCFAEGYEAAIVELNAGILAYILANRRFTPLMRGEWKGKRVYLIPHRTYHEERFTVRGDNDPVLTLPENAQLLY